MNAADCRQEQHPLAIANFLDELSLEYAHCWFGPALRRIADAYRSHFSLAEILHSRASHAAAKAGVR